MSLVDIQHSSPATVEPTSDPNRPLSASTRTNAAPSHISLIAPQVLSAFFPSPNPSPSHRDNPFETPPSSPPLPFFTAPSTPLTSPQCEDPPQYPPTASLHQLTSNARPLSPPPANIRLPSPGAPPCQNETILPSDALVAPDLALDFTLDDDGLSTLEKIYLFSRSRSTHHRVFISHALPSFLAQVTPLEAVEYVLPLLPNLAMDEEESVKEALASELVEILWWFLTHCRLAEELPDSETNNIQEQQGINEDVTLISVQAFTPILGTLLLSPNGMVSGPARYAVVDLLGRMRKVEDAEDQMSGDLERSGGLFGRPQRQMFEEELIHQLVIGIGRLDASVEDDDVSEVWYDATARTPAGELPEDQATAPTFLASDQYHETPVNPYFPLPTPNHLPATSSPASALSPSSTMSAPSTSTALLSPPPGIPPLRFVDELPPVDPSPMATIAFRYDAAGTGEPPSGEITPQPEHQSVRQECGEADDEFDPAEQAAVGRLSSMSLIAAVAASGSLRFDAQRAFVREVERAGKDPVYWVRREASFALGALAKVIPEELVVSTLLPLLGTLRTDTVWHVRHSSLFALPAVLACLPSELRRSVALSTVVPLSRDESPAVRSAVLEALGEVLYSFHTEPCGPPTELLELFLGREGECGIREPSRPSAYGMPFLAPSAVSEYDPFYDDPARPLACAFNYPAVALTLGRARWGELRGLYLTLAQNRSTKVRRTLAASLGELAMVIGPDNARRDLVNVWWDAMRCDEDGDIRLKAIEAVPTLVDALGEGEARDSIFAGLVKLWEEGWLRNWRAREGVINILPDLVGSLTHPECVHQLLKRGLEDDFGAVREVSISMVTRMWRENDAWAVVLDRLHQDLLALAHSPSFRKRMTYIACRQAVASSSEGNACAADTADWEALQQLASDNIVGVRIGVARLVRCLSDKFARSSGHVPRIVIDLVHHLRLDSSAEVRSYVPSSMDARQDRLASPIRCGAFETFSRPPKRPHQAFDTAQATSR
ncbi:ARM repeat-containing protein [Paxillus ammoniavirescens]|nr:ARM repeat-containing protein [Paxillus ammoniavirescens]